MAEMAYVLIETQVGKTKEVIEAVRGSVGVVSVHATTGPYDAIATMEGKSLTEIGELVMTNIHSIGGISKTVTCLVMKSQ